VKRPVNVGADLPINNFKIEETPNTLPLIRPKSFNNSVNN